MPKVGITVPVNTEAKAKANTISSPPVKLNRFSRPRSISGFSNDSSSTRNASRNRAEATNSESTSGESNQSSRCPTPSAAVSDPANSASSAMPP